MRSIIRYIARRLLAKLRATVVNSSIGVGARVESTAKIVDSVIENDVYVGPASRLFHVRIGPFASIGPGVTIGENEHEQKLFSTSDLLFESMVRPSYEESKNTATCIGADVWIGCNAFIRKGTHVGVGAIVGAHAVVLKDVPPFAIVVGIPARVIGFRFSPSTCQKLEQSRWWLLEKPQLQAALLQRYGKNETSSMRSEEEILAFVESLPLAASERETKRLSDKC